jgi:hypothetical protein
MAVIREARNSRNGNNESMAQRRELLTQAARRQLIKALEDSFQRELQDVSFLSEITENIKTKKDVVELENSIPEKMDFPIIMFPLAVAVDLIDLAEFTGIAYLITIIVKLIFTAILIAWLMGKVNGLFRGGSRAAFQGSKSIVQKQARALSKKYLLKFLSRRAVAIIIVNFVPGLSILASWGFFVFLAYKQHNKLVQAYMQAINSTRH